MWMLLAIVLPMLAGGGLALWRPRDRRARQNYVVAFACLTSVCALSAVFTLRGEAPLMVLSLGEKLTIAFHVDGLSCIFAALVSVLWPLACLYAVEYMSREGAENRFFAFYLISFGVTLGIAFSANVLTMYLFYELLTLATLPLVMHAMDSKARYAGRVYLTYSMCGAALGFIAMVMMIEHGSWFFQFGGSVVVPDGKEQTLRLAYILGFFGFGVKAAVFPGHKWLLRASVAPTPVTALLHAVAVVKAGVFAVARITWYGFGPDLLRGSWCQYLAMGAAMFTIVYASSKALRTKHLKRRLAWSTISNLSYILLGIATLTTAGLVAGMVHLVAHAVLKITLFFCVGAVHYKMHRDFVPDVEGCGVLMPVVFGCFAVASLGLMGVPPLAGFASKWLLATSAVGLGEWAGYLSAAVLIVSALLTALYLMEIVLLAFFPRQNRQLTVSVPKRARRDPSWRMTLPLTVLSAGSVGLGLGAGALEQVIVRLLGV